MKTKLLPFILCVVLVLSNACNGIMQTGPLQSESRTVELGGAEQVDVALTISAGTLHVTGGAADLMAADFTYNVDAWQPEVDYAVNNGRGVLKVRQPHNVAFNFPGVKNARNEWRVQLNDTIPIDLAITLGAGEGDLKLATLNLDNLDIETGASSVTLDLHNGHVRHLDILSGVGAVTLDLRGAWQDDVVANITGGVGQVTVLLPSQVNVHAEVHGGLGELVTTGLQKDGDTLVHKAPASDVTLTLDIEGGVGQVELAVQE
ncbi:MAG: hypothetical protein DYG89_02345 [Caldilinea sp. CFX5]|nr:hypothetical protein [Caldilinea sp. CFX5]